MKQIHLIHNAIHGETFCRATGETTLEVGEATCPECLASLEAFRDRVLGPRLAVMRSDGSIVAERDYGSLGIMGVAFDGFSATVQTVSVAPGSRTELRVATGERSPADLTIECG